MARAAFSTGDRVLTHAAVLHQPSALDPSCPFCRGLSRFFLSPVPFLFAMLSGGLRGWHFLVADLKMEIDGIECEIDPDDTIDDVLKCAGDGDDQQVSD